MVFLKGFFALLLALVAAVTFTQDPRPQGAYAGTGCGGATQPYPQVTKDMKGTKFDCTMTIYNDRLYDAAGDLILCLDEYGDPIPDQPKTDMYAFLRCNKGKDYYGFATVAEDNCYTQFVQEQTALEGFLRDTVLPGIYGYESPPVPSPFCSVWLAEKTGIPCDPFSAPFAIKSVMQVAEDQVGVPPNPLYDTYAWFTEGMYVSVFDFVLAVED